MWFSFCASSGSVLSNVPPFAPRDQPRGLFSRALGLRSVCKIEVARPFECPTRLSHPHPPVLPAVRWRTVTGSDYERRNGTASKCAQGQGTEACADGCRLLGGCSDEARRGEGGGEGSQSSRRVSDFASPRDTLSFDSFICTKGIFFHSVFLDTFFSFLTTSNAFLFCFVFCLSTFSRLLCVCVFRTCFSLPLFLVCSGPAIACPLLQYT